MAGLWEKARIAFLFSRHLFAFLNCETSESPVKFDENVARHMVISLKDYSPPSDLEIQDLACIILGRKTQHRKVASNFPAKIFRTHFVLQRLSVKRGGVGRTV